MVLQAWAAKGGLAVQRQRLASMAHQVQQVSTEPMDQPMVAILAGVDWVQTVVPVQTEPVPAPWLLRRAAAMAALGAGVVQGVSEVMAALMVPMALTATAAMLAMAVQGALVVPVLKARLPVTAVAAALPVLAALAEALLPMAWGAMVVLVDLAEMVFRANLGMALPVAWVAAGVTLYRGRQEVAATAETAVLAVLA